MKVSKTEEPPIALTPQVLQAFAIPPAPLRVEWPDAPTLSDAPMLRLTLVGAGNEGDADDIRRRADDELFAAVFKRGWEDRRVLTQAVLRARARADEARGFPLVLVPYLSEASLRYLEAERVSGLDLCGNGVILQPSERWFLRWSGRPNRFRQGGAGGGLKNPYQGRASQLARLLLLSPILTGLTAAHAEIERRGGTVSLPVVFQAAQRLEADALIERQKRGAVRLLQPDALLDRLAAAMGAARAPVWCGRVAGATGEFLPRLFARAAERNIVATLTGVASAPRYTGLAGDLMASVYVERGRGLELAETTGGVSGPRFANLEIHETDDAARVFDRRADAETGLVWASPIQTYLEMAGGGAAQNDARLQQSAGDLRERILMRQIPHEESAAAL